MAEEDVLLSLLASAIQPYIRFPVCIVFLALRTLTVTPQDHLRLISPTTNWRYLSFGGPRHGQSDVIV